MTQRVVITGMGALTSLGATVPEFWSAVRAGQCGIAPIRAYDTSSMAAKLAAEVSFDPAQALAPGDMRKMDRYTQLAVIAAREAVADSGITADNTDFNRVDVIASSGIGGMATTTREYSRGMDRGFDKISPFYIPMTIANIAAARISTEHGLHGDSSCIVTACASSNHAIGEAMRHIRHGYADAVVCGGSEAVVIPLAVGGFTSMQALHLGADPTRASIPFDAERSGFVMGEGAGMLVLESLENAQARGAHIYAEVAGFGATCDAYHLTAPEPNATGTTAAMMRALQDADLTPADISYLNAHGTSTPLNDKSEVLAIHKVFGQHTTLPVSSSKSMTGHLLGAAGAIEAIICTCAVVDAFIPPTINYRVPDPECDIDVVPNTGRPAALSAVMSNTFGFGGHNASLVITRMD